jgi:hypothetical protein
MVTIVVAAEPGTAAAEEALPGLGELAGKIRLLSQEVQFAAVAGETAEFMAAARALRAAQAEWDSRYESWLAFRQATL